MRETFGRHNFSDPVETLFGLDRAALRDLLTSGLPGYGSADPVPSARRFGIEVRQQGHLAAQITLQPSNRQLHIESLNAPVTHTGFGRVLARNILALADAAKVKIVTTDADYHDGASFWLNFMRPAAETSPSGFKKFLGRADLRRHIENVADTLTATPGSDRNAAAHTLRDIIRIDSDYAMLDALRNAACPGEAKNFLWHACLDEQQVACLYDPANAQDIARRQAFFKDARYQGPETLPLPMSMPP